ncbi:MAG: hypothetical protein ACKOAH_13275, partial [Pirellula sp.]
MIAATGCDYRWTDADREQTRQTLAEKIARGSSSDSASVDIPKDSDAEPKESKPNSSADPLIDQSSSSPESTRTPWVDRAALPSLQWEIIYLGN